MNELHTAPSMSKFVASGTVVLPGGSTLDNAFVVVDGEVIAYVGTDLPPQYGNVRFHFILHCYNYLELLFFCDGVSGFCTLTFGKFTEVSPTVTLTLITKLQSVRRSGCFLISVSVFTIDFVLTSQLYDPPSIHIC